MTGGFRENIQRMQRDKRRILIMFFFIGGLVPLQEDEKSSRSVGHAEFQGR